MTYEYVIVANFGNGREDVCSYEESEKDMAYKDVKDYNYMSDVYYRVVKRRVKIGKVH